MTTAQVLFEQYKVLPKRTQRELKVMIDQAEKSRSATEDDDDDSGYTIHISMKALNDSIREVKKLKAGKQKTRPARELIAELTEELANEH